MEKTNIFFKDPRWTVKYPKLETGYVIGAQILTDREGYFAT